MLVDDPDVQYNHSISHQLAILIFNCGKVAPMMTITVLPVCLFFCMYFVRIVDAYPNEAGACHGNQAAVQGSHLSKINLDDDSAANMNRIVQTGSIELNTNRFVYINGRPFSPTVTVDLQYGIEYLIEIVATGGKPFKGVLIRIESLAFTEQERQQGVSTFTLEPLTNAQSAEACGSGDPTSTVQGVTHYDNSLKYAFSTKLILSPPSYNTTKHSFYAMDVTIVDYNNATGSVYWYTQYTFEGVVELSEDDKNSIPAIAPAQPTESPTSSPYPTYMNKCYVCDNETARVVNPTNKVLIFNEAATCSDIEYEGRHGLIPPQHCTIIKAAVQDACSCEDVPIPVAIPKNEFPTMAPTMTSKPTTTVMPTDKEKCHVCNGDANQIVTNNLQLIQLQGQTGTCIDLHDDGLEGYIHPDLCPEAQNQAAMYCNCTTIPILDPTTSPAPSTSPYPSYSEKCYVCNDDANQRITAVQQIVNVDGRIGTCFDLQEQGLEGYIHPSLCSDAQQIASKICDCKTMSTPSSLKTLAPTITPFPTQTNTPTYESACYVCGEASIATTNHDVIVALEDNAITCKELEEVGLEHNIPPAVCPKAQKAALLSCGCTRIEERSPTMLPTYKDKCHICGSNEMTVTHNKTLVLVQDQILNCEELWEAGTWGLLPPQFCDEAKQRAAEFCGCQVSTSVTAPASLSTISPTVTPQPTITSRPTYQEKCNICSDDASKNDGSDNPADSTRNVRNNDGDDSLMNGVLEYDGILWDCNVLQELGDSGSISPQLCLVFQEKAKVSCPCNAHKIRDDPRIPKLKSTGSGKNIQDSLTLCIAIIATLVAIIA